MNNEIIKKHNKRTAQRFFLFLTLEDSLQYFLPHIKFEGFWEVFLEFQSFGKNNDSIRVL